MPLQKNPISLLKLKYGVQVENFCKACLDNVIWNVPANAFFYFVLYSREVLISTFEKLRDLARHAMLSTNKSNASSPWANQRRTLGWSQANKGPKRLSFNQNRLESHWEKAYFTIFLKNWISTRFVCGNYWFFVKVSISKVFAVFFCVFWSLITAIVWRSLVRKWPSIFDVFYLAAILDFDTKLLNLLDYFISPEEKTGDLELDSKVSLLESKKFAQYSQKLKMIEDRCNFRLCVSKKWAFARSFHESNSWFVHLFEMN